MMMDQSAKLQAFAFVAAAALLLSQVAAEDDGKRKIRLENNVADRMAVRCFARDKTDVRSNNNVSYGDSWRFNFYPTLERPVYGCTFWWGSKPHFQVIYDPVRAYYLAEYYWKAKNDSACLVVDSKGTANCFSWGRPP